MLSNKTIKANKKILFYIFIAALLLRALFLFTASVIPDINLNQDFEYGIIARSLVAGEGYSAPILEISSLDGHYKETDNYRPTADQLPFYPLLLAIIYSISNSPFSFLIIIFLQAIFSSITCIVIYLIALKLFNKRTAIIAGISSAIYPLFIFNTTRIIPETFFTFWLSLSVLYLLILRDAPSFRNQLISGILLGINLLNSNVLVPALPFIGLWLFWLFGSWKEKVQRIFLVMATALLIVSPWIVRNYIVFGEFPLMKTTIGLNFWLGNNPSATGTFFLQSGEPMASILSKSFDEGFKLSETEQDKRLYDEAVAYVKENPLHFARLFLKKFYYFTWFPPDNLISKDSMLYKKLFQIPYGLILMSSVMGIILFFRRNAKDAFLLSAIIFSVAVLYSIFIVGHMRYRMPIEPYIILFSAYAASLLLDKYSLIYMIYEAKSHFKAEPTDFNKRTRHGKNE